MKRLYGIIVIVGLFCLLFGSTVWAGALQKAAPEAVGLSSERLKLIDAVLKADIEEGKIPGAVVLVARKGKIA